MIHTKPNGPDLGEYVIERDAMVPRVLEDAVLEALTVLAGGVVEGG